MSVQHAIWKIEDPPVPLLAIRLDSEQQLEEMIARDPSILSSELMLIGRQVMSGNGGRIDLLAVAPDGSLVLIELKRDRTPREVVAQALDYASWVQGLSADTISQIYQRFSSGKRLEEEFQKRFGLVLEEEALNQSHQVIIVASSLDDATERILGYLNARNIAINVAFFQAFANGEENLLSRAWLIDPAETQANVVTTRTTRGEKEPWNGEYYVSYGGDRSWDDASEFGFISAGGGPWFSRTLNLLKPGDRVWVNVPRVGYVGVGRVVEERQSLGEFTVQTPDGGWRPVLEVLQDAERYRQSANDPDRVEYFVRIEWLDKVSKDRAVNEIGLFGNQNTVCQPTTARWRQTIKVLKDRFPRWDALGVR